MEIGSHKRSREYVKLLEQIDGLSEAISRLGAGEGSESVACATEFILEGLHLNRRLNRDLVGDGFRYRG